MSGKKRKTLNHSGQGAASNHSVQGAVSEQTSEQTSEHTSIFGKKKKYKINYKRLSLLVGGVALLIGLIVGIVFWSRPSDGEKKVYDVLVQLRDQKNSDPIEDAKSSAKKGDVVSLRVTGSEWSKTEKISYLILKMELTEEEAQKIVQSETKKLKEKEALEKGIANEEMLKNMPREEKANFLVEDVLFREYRINFEKLPEFDEKEVRNGQPFEEKIFGWEIVEKK